MVLRGGVLSQMENIIQNILSYLSEMNINGLIFISVIFGLVIIAIINAIYQLSKIIIIAVIETTKKAFNFFRNL